LILLLETIIFFKDISNSTYGLYELRLELLIYLVSQPAGEDVYHVRLGIEVIIPDMLHNHCLGKNVSSVPQQIFQEGELFGIQVYGLPSLATVCDKRSTERSL
jgi:hypothetical protein